MKSTFSLFLLLAFTSLSFAQHIKIDKKELAFLKAENTILVRFNYDAITYNGDNLSEKAFLDYFKTKSVSKKIDTVAWHHAFYEHKNKLWQNAYVNKLNETLARYQSPIFTLDDTVKSNYTMIVDVSWIYLGYDIGVAKSPSKIKLNLRFVNLESKEKNITIRISETSGENDNADNDSQWPYLRRVGNAFMNSGFKFGIALKRLFDKK